MKTIKPLDGYNFKRLIRYNNKLYLLAHNVLFSEDSIDYYLIDIITEEQCPTASYPYRKPALIFQDKIFPRTSYRIDDDLYVTKYYPIVLTLPYAYPDADSYTENLGMDLLEGVMVSTKSSDRCQMPHYGHRFCHFNHLACIASKISIDDYGSDILVVQHYVKYIKHLSSDNPKEVVIYQPQHGMPKIFRLPHHAGSMAIHPTEPLAIIWDEEFCTMIDLEL